MRPQRSCASLDLAVYSVEDCIDFQFKHGKVGLIAALVSGDGTGAAEDDVAVCDRTGVADAMWAIARGIGGTEESDCRRSKGDGEMQRTRIAVALGTRSEEHT